MNIDYFEEEIFKTTKQAFIIITKAEYKRKSVSLILKDKNDFRVQAETYNEAFRRILKKLDETYAIKKDY